jgi:hypothetical protein
MSQNFNERKELPLPVYPRDSRSKSQRLRDAGFKPSETPLKNVRKLRNFDSDEKP